MASYHMILFSTMIFFWYVIANAQFTIDKKNSYLVPEKTRQLFLPSSRSRKITQRAFQDMDLLSARSYGKRASDCLGGLCGKRMPQFGGARLYGKRDVNMNQIKCLLFDCEGIENTFRNTDFPDSRFNKFRDDEDIIPSD